MATPPDFSVGQVLTAAHMDAVGLWLIDTVTVSNASTLDIEGCFTSDFDNYRLLFNGYANTSNTNVRMRMFSGTNTPDTGINYDRFGFSWTSSATNQVLGNQTSLFIGEIANISASRMVVSMDIFNPNVANVHTTFLPTAWGDVTGTAYLMPGRCDTSTQYTGVRFYLDTGNLTATCSVYGYRL